MGRVKKQENENSIQGWNRVLRSVAKKDPEGKKLCKFVRELLTTVVNPEEAEHEISCVGGGTEHTDEDKLNTLVMNSDLTEITYKFTAKKLNERISQYEQKILVLKTALNKRRNPQKRIEFCVRKMCDLNANLIK